MTNCSHAIEQIETELRGGLPNISGNSQSALEAELTYPNNNKDRMRDAGLAPAVCPAAMASPKAPQRTVINQRAKGAGQRWKERGVRAVLGVRKHRTERTPASLLASLLTPYVTNITCATPRLVNGGAPFDPSVVHTQSVHVINSATRRIVRR